MNECLCLHAEENALLEAGRERVGEDAILYCNTYVPPPFPIPLNSAHTTRQLPLPPVLGQDRPNGRQRGRVQPKLLDGCAECAGVEGGWGDVEAVGDAAYVDVRCMEGRWTMVMITTGW